MIRIGEPAPEFSLPASDGSWVSLSQLRGQIVVLYFYPKANSLGCTLETQEFQRSLPKFSSRNAAVIGISVDSTEAQKKFSDRCALRFPLLADTTKEVARSYGVLGFLGAARRVTVIVDPQGKVADIIESPRPSAHIRRALERIEAGSLSSAAPPQPPSPPEP
jgi:peroxiredoxin Q/BCP